MVAGSKVGEVFVGVGVMGGACIEMGSECSERFLPSWVSSRASLLPSPSPSQLGRKAWVVEVMTIQPAAGWGSWGEECGSRHGEIDRSRREDFKRVDWTMPCKSARGAKVAVVVVVVGVVARGEYASGLGREYGGVYEQARAS